MNNNLKQCPICQRKFLNQGLKNHIINTAKGEMWRGEKSKHKEYIDKNALKLPGNNITLKYHRI